MGNFYLDDQLFDHPKALAAGEDATNLYVRILAWCHRHNTGHIPKGAVQSLTTKKAAAPTKALVAAGFLEDRQDDYEIHDWYDRNERMRARRQQAKTAAEHRWRNAKRNADAYANAPPGALQTALLDGMPEPCDRNAEPMPYDKDKDLAKAQQLTENAKHPPRAGPDAALIDQALTILADRRIAGNGQVRNPAGYRKAIIEGLRRDRSEILANLDFSAPWTPQMLADWLEPQPIDTSRRDYQHERVDCPLCNGSSMVLDENNTAHPCNHQPADT